MKYLFCYLYSTAFHSISFHCIYYKIFKHNLDTAPTRQKSEPMKAKNFEAPNTKRGNKIRKNIRPNTLVIYPCQSHKIQLAQTNNGFHYSFLMRAKLP